MTKRIGVIFPGYGEQFIGMGKDLYDQSRIVQEFFEQAAGTADLNFVKLTFASSDEDISSIRMGYLAIYLFECSLYETLYQKGLRPDFVAGYGIGEYAACFASRSLSFIDGLYLLNKYAQFYDEFLQDKNYSVLRITRGFTQESLQELCDELGSEKHPVYISARNSLEGFYVAGDATTILKIKKHCEKEVIRKVKDIGAAYQMHSPLVDQIVDQIKLYYHKVKFLPLEIPLITNVDAVYVTAPEAVEGAMMRKINKPIQWFETMQGFEGCDVILSVGPGNQLIDWFQELYPDKEYRSITSIKDFAALEDLLIKPEETEVPVENKEDSQEIEHEKSKDLREIDMINELPSDFDDEEE